jgi:hypothetical protein
MAQLTEQQFKDKWRKSWTAAQIPFTEEDLDRKWKETLSAKISPTPTPEVSPMPPIEEAERGPQRRQEELTNLRELQRREGVPESQLASALRPATPQELAAEQMARSLRTQEAMAPKAAAPAPKAIQKPAQNLSQQLSKKPTSELKTDIKKALDVSEAVTAAPAAEAASPEAIDRFKQERDRAYELYDKAKTRNEWLEVAQVLGQAFTQYGAAQAGMRTGRPMAGLQIPGIDYGARTAQEQRLLETRLRDIGGAEEREERLSDKLRREQLERQKLGLEERELGIKERIARQPTAAALPKESVEERQIRREERLAERKETEQKKAALEKALGAQQVIASDSSTKKQKEKAQEVLAESAAAAGLDLEQIEIQSQVPGILGGLFGTKTDQKLVLKNIKDSLNVLKQGRQQAPAPATIEPQAPAPTGGGTVTVIHKATGQSRQYPAGSPEVERAKSDPDFEVR